MTTPEGTRDKLYNKENTMRKTELVNRHNSNFRRLHYTLGTSCRIEVQRDNVIREYRNISEHSFNRVNLLMAHSTYFTGRLQTVLGKNMAILWITRA